MTESEFDKVSTNYEKALNHGISLSGENADYFASNRVEHVAKLHTSVHAKSETIMDYGCGTGGSVYLLDAFTPKRLFAVDVSEKSLGILKTRHHTQQVVAKNLTTLSLNPIAIYAFAMGYSTISCRRIENRLLRLFTIHFNRLLFSFLGKQSVESRDTLGYEQNSLRWERSENFPSSGRQFASKGRLRD